jgi:uncharacterized protein (TIGR00369 family)
VRHVDEAMHRQRPSLLGYRILEASQGRSLVSWTPTQELANPVGMVHGGFVGVLVDDTCGSAVASLLDELRAFPTASMHVDFLRGVPVGEECRCRGAVLRAGRRLTVAETVIADRSGKVLAKGTCTFALDLSGTDLVGFSAAGTG